MKVPLLANHDARGTGTYRQPRPTGGHGTPTAPWATQWCSSHDMHAASAVYSHRSKSAA